MLLDLIFYIAIWKEQCCTIFYTAMLRMLVSRSTLKVCVKAAALIPASVSHPSSTSRSEKSQELSKAYTYNSLKVRLPHTRITHVLLSRKIVINTTLNTIVYYSLQQKSAAIHIMSIHINIYIVQYRYTANVGWIHKHTYTYPWLVVPTRWFPQG